MLRMVYMTVTSRAVGGSRAVSSWDFEGVLFDCYWQSSSKIEDKQSLIERQQVLKASMDFRSINARNCKHCNYN